MNGRVSNVLMDVNVVTLLGGWKSLEFLPVNETISSVHVCISVHTGMSSYQPLRFIFCNRLSADFISSLIFLSAPYGICAYKRIQHKTPRYFSNQNIEAALHTLTLSLNTLILQTLRYTGSALGLKSS